MSGSAHGELDSVYRTEARRVLSTLIRLLGGFQAAEEGLHEAFLAAAASWPQSGMPKNPYAWLVSAGHNRVVDRWRREKKVRGAVADLPPEGRTIPIRTPSATMNCAWSLPAAIQRCRPMAAWR